MATVFKALLDNDRVSTRTLLHEAIPITGSIVSGTYVVGSTAEEQNIKNYSHGQFQSVYDYPFLSSSANHIFDLTVGYSPHSALSGTSARLQQKEKINIYNQMAQILAGHDHTGAIRQFDKDGDLTGGEHIKECYFLNFNRLLAKDEIKKGSFKLELGVDPPFNASKGPFNQRILIQDTNATTAFKTNSPAGEYAVLSASNGTGTPLHSSPSDCGLIYYQAGIAVLTASLFASGSGHGQGGLLDLNQLSMSNVPADAPFDVNTVLTGTSISGNCDMLRHRIYDIDFNNTTELNSTIYFCRANHNEFNYSSSPTYLSSSQIRVKNNSLDEPVSYITTIGLYSDDNELLAVAKLSEPVKKTPSQEVTFRVRLDY